MAIAAQPIVAGNLQAPKAITATVESVKNATKLKQHIVDLRDEVNAIARAVIHVPLSFGHLLTSVSFASGVTNYVAHGLGRPYLGYIVTAAYTPASGSLIVTSLPSGKTADKFIGLVSAVNGKFDILVF